MLPDRRHIRVDDELFTVVRALYAHTEPEQAQAICARTGADTVLRASNGVWYCCNRIRDAEVVLKALPASKKIDE